MPAFELSGTYNGSTILAGIQQLQNALNNIKAPTITPQVNTPNLGNFLNALNTAEAKTIKIKTEVDNSFSGGFNNFLNSDKGKFSNAGRELGNSLTQGMQQQFGMLGGMGASIAGAMGPAGTAIAAITAATVGLGAAAITAAKNWQTLQTGFGKTTGLNSQKQELYALGDEVLKLSTRAGMGTKENLATIVELAGSQGIGAKAADAGNYSLQRQQLLAYTQDVQGMSTAFGMTAEESATMGAAVQKSFKLPMDEIHHTGSMVTAVGDSIGVQEKKILEFLSRAGGSSIAVSQGVTKTAAFGAALMSTGMEAEVAASSITMMESQVLSSDKKMQAWAKTLGVTKDQLWQMAKTDFYGTVLKTGDVMSKMDLTKSIPLATEIFGAEVAKYVGKMGGVGADYGFGVGKGESAFKEGTKLAQAFGDKGADVGAKWTAAMNTVDVALIHLGSVALPVAGQLVDSFSGAIRVVDALGSALYGAFSKGSSAIAGFLSNTGSTAATGGQSLSGWLNGATGGALGYDEMADPNSPAGKKLAAMQAKANAIPETPLTMGQKFTESTAMAEAGDKSGIVFADALKTSMAPQVKAAYAGLITPDIQAQIDAQMKGAGTSAGDVFGEGFSKAMKDMKISERIGAVQLDKYGNMQMSGVQALGIINSQSNDAGPTFETMKRVGFPLLKSYSLQKRTSSPDATYRQGDASVIDEEGKLVLKQAWAEAASGGISYTDISHNLEKAIKPVFSDMPKYMSNVGNYFQGEISNIMSDTVIELDEKTAAQDMVKQLDALQLVAPVEFVAMGFGKIRDDLFKLGEGIPVTFNAKLETNYARWKRDNADTYQKTYEILKPKYGDTEKSMPTDTSERELHNRLNLLGNERMNLAYSDFDKAINSGDVADAEAAAGWIQEIADTDPALLALSATTQRLDAIQTQYSMQVVRTGATYTVLDKNGMALASSHLDAAAAGKILGNGLTSLAASAYVAATALRSIGSNTASPQNVVFPASTNQWASTSIADQKAARSFPQKAVFSPPGAKTYPFDYFSDWSGIFHGLPKLAVGGKVTAGGLAWIGEKGTEYVIPESDIKGLWAKSADIDKGSFAYQSNYQYFNDYPAPKISKPQGYRWSSFPAAPQVQEYNTKGIQTAWLADKQLNTRDIYSGQIRQAQLDAIGKNSVMPWFARGMQDQPKWWSDAATKLSPQYASSWTAQKGGEVPKIVPDNIVAGRATLNAPSISVGSDAWNLIYPDSKTCINYNKPDPSGIFNLTPKKVNFDSDAWNLIYPDSQTCIAYNQPDGLSFTPGAGYEVGGDHVGGGGVTAILAGIEKNTGISADKIGLAASYNGQMTTVLKSPINGFDDGNPFGKLSTGGVSASPSDALVTGLSKEGYVIQYDPNSDTCEGLPFNAPDPSLETTNPWLLGITNPKASAPVDQDGWNRQVAHPPANRQDLIDAQRDALSYQETAAKTGKDTAKGVDSLNDAAREIIAQGGQPIIVQNANGGMSVINGMGGSYGGDSLVSGSSGGGRSWGAGPRYGSNLFPNAGEWVGAGYDTEPSWGGEAASDDAAKYYGQDGTYVVGHQYQTSRKASGPSQGQKTAQHVDSTGGSYGGWVPAFASEAFVPSPTFALVGDRPGGEYVVGADRFERVAAKIGSGQISIVQTNYISGDTAQIEAIVDRKNGELVEQITRSAGGL